MILRTEHAGAKNGGGFWGKRQDAKDLSRMKRRSDGRLEVKIALEEIWKFGREA